MSARLLTWVFLVSGVAESLFAQTSKPAATAEDKATTKKAAPKKEKEKEKEKEKDENELYYSVLGLGKNIPDPGYYRFRNILRFSDGKETIDGDGKASKSGLTYFQVADLISVEASLTDRVSFLIALPYVYRNDLSLNIKTFRNSDRYTAEVAKVNALFVKKLTKGLLAAGECDSETSCGQLAAQKIANNDVLPSSTLTLPTGEVVTTPTATASQLNSLIGDLVTNAAIPNSGATGIGDLDIGASYSPIITGRQVLNIGVGFRIPTGKFENVPATQVPTGEGMLQYGVRVSYDLLIGKGLMISIQDQAVGMILSGHRKKSSLLDPNQLNKADPTTDEAIDAGGDGSPNDQVVRKKGLSHDMIVRADFGAAYFGRAFQPLAIEASYNRHLGAEVYYDDTLMYPKQTINSFIYGFKIDGLGFVRPFPAYLKMLKETFLDGKNVPIATNSLYFEISIYQNI